MVALESVSLFRDLRPEELKALRAVAQERRFSAGEMIFMEGEPAESAYLVKEGLVEICGGTDPATRRVFTRINPGEIFGEMAVFELKPRSASAVAAKDSVVYFIPSGELLGLTKRSAGLALSLLQVVTARLREFNELHLREVLQAEQLAVVGRFARAIVHDLKNTLTIIGLTAEMACMPEANAQARKKAHEQIRKQIERINDLISEILQFTQGTQADVAISAMDYSAFIRQVFEELRNETEVKSVKVELANEPPKVTLLINPKRLRRVFFNLLHNAFDVMPNGGKVFLRFRQSPKEVVTEIEDTGPGIAPEVAGKLFEAFATHGKEHGTGLGLSICKKIVEDHGGRISARNEKGRGAVFSFTLPIKTP
jgi:signal transduction histidine kinase